MTYGQRVRAAERKLQRTMERNEKKFIAVIFMQAGFSDVLKCTCSTMQVNLVGCECGNGWN